MLQEHLSTAGKRARVSQQKSAEVNALIGELCSKVGSGHELTAQVNQRARVNLGEHAVWKRCRKVGHQWPGGAEPRLTPEQSRQVDTRLRELIEAGMPGTEIVKTINREMGLNLTLAAYFARAQRLELQWPPTPKAGRPWLGTEKFSEDQWKACYDDPVYEARKGIHDRLVCRECLRKALDGLTDHVALYRDGAMDGEDGHVSRIHHMSTGDCHFLNPGTPINTWDRIAKERKNKTGSACDVVELMARKADEYATPEELAAAQNNPDYDTGKPYRICRVPRCGFKSIARLTEHFSGPHRMSRAQIKAHRREYRWYDIMPEDYRRASAARNRKHIAKLQQKAWRPPDWEDDEKWPAWKKSIALVMLEHPDLGGARKTGQLMDETKGKGKASRPPEDWFENTDDAEDESWERAFTETQAGKRMFYRIKVELRH